MNYWKIAFWICFTALLTTAACSVYSIIDQAVTLTYLREGYEHTEDDLDHLIGIINDTNLSKEQIQERLLEHALYEHMEFATDTVTLYKIEMIFDAGHLRHVAKKW